ncbi:MAG: hypothetical protein JSU95_09855 [Betaproteobacteria bacterium]|nr:MAG: hypothetical protein JSU95_09855 [Betaproteobacteria bacterium]
MIVYIAGLITMGAAGFFIGGAWTSFALVISWSAFAASYWQFQTRKAQARRQSHFTSPAQYAGINEIFDSLGDIAREREWDIEKRLEIAGLACEHRNMTFDELEQLYDRGIRSSLGKNRRTFPESPNSDETDQ